jgi:hypothetical protein
MLLNQPVEIFPFLLVLLIFEGGFRLHGRVG